LLFSSDPIDAKEAQAIGLVDEIVEPDALPQRLAERATELAQGPTLALGLAKRLLQDSYAADLATFLKHEVSAQGVLLQSDDYREGRLALREKRDPRFTGR
jgi:2-(1,2-epoxy-1,2-dihydrophenyl)acetyl-CoA isomerase